MGAGKGYRRIGFIIDEGLAQRLDQARVTLAKDPDLRVSLSALVELAITLLIERRDLPQLVKKAGLKAKRKLTDD